MWLETAFEWLEAVFRYLNLADWPRISINTRQTIKVFVCCSEIERYAFLLRMNGPKSPQGEEAARCLQKVKRRRGGSHRLDSVKMVDKTSVNIARCTEKHEKLSLAPSFVIINLMQALENIAEWTTKNKTTGGLTFLVIGGTLCYFSGKVSKFAPPIGWGLITAGSLIGFTGGVITFVGLVRYFRKSPGGGAA